MNIPIVFIRQWHPTGGHFHGIPIALRTALKWNPSGRVIFISDEKQPSEWKNIAEHHPVERYSRLKDGLEKHWPFRNNRTPDEWFLWASLSNWLILAEWMNQHNVDFACVVDCDVLIFCDVTKECQNWRDYDYAACNPAGTAQAPTFITRRALTDFAGWLIGVYDKSCTVGNTVWSESKCCMSAFRHWSVSRPDLKIGNPGDVIDGGTWCHNNGMDYGSYEFADGGRVFQWRDGQPWCRNLESGRDVRFRAIHAWGKWKGQIGEFVARSEESMK